MLSFQQQRDNSWRIEGELLLQDAPAALRRGCELIRRAKPLQLDLSPLLRFDSSLFSFLLSLFREAEKCAAELRISALPSGFLAQAELYGCRELMLQLCHFAYPPRLVHHD